MAIVYQHKRKDTNQIFYIGISKDPKRPYSKNKRNPYWKNIVNKYGYNIEITHQDIIWEEACVIEKYLISFYGRKDLGLGPLVNMTDGGEGLISENYMQEIREKISKSKTGKKRGPLSEEHRRKISESCKGKNKKSWSEDRKEKLRKPLSEETKSKMKLAWIKRKEKGFKHWNEGKKHSEETKSKMKNAWKNRK